MSASSLANLDSGGTGGLLVRRGWEVGEKGEGDERPTEKAHVGFGFACSFGAMLAMNFWLGEIQEPMWMQEPTTMASICVSSAVLQNLGL